MMRISQRLGWTKNTDAEKIERDLCAILPKGEWDHASHVLIFHGRRVCFARKPDCEGCSVNDVCPAAFDADHVGRKNGSNGANGKSAPKGKTAVGRKAAASETVRRKPVGKKIGARPRPRSR